MQACIKTRESRSPKDKDTDMMAERLEDEHMSKSRGGKVNSGQQRKRTPKHACFLALPLASVKVPIGRVKKGAVLYMKVCASRRAT